MNFAPKHAALLLAIAAAAPTVTAQCPNLRAVNRAAHWEGSDTGTRCRRVLSIFGLTIGLGSSFCPDVRFLYPARRDCMAVPDAGTDCEKIGEVGLERWECSCTTLIDVDLGLAEQSCNCTLQGNESMFDDHATIPCSTP
ncbi:MAG: hypothetical protein NTY35_10995 [Planctomycetota bacterium]|nr:hypothetical protein [Planctomycetota bacterium]